MTRTTHPFAGTLPRLLAAAMTLGVIAVLTSGASAQLSYECITFSPSNPGPSLYTWDDYDRWVLEAGGETFVFDDVGANTLITSGNGADIDVVHKCAEVEVPEAPTPTVGPVTPEPTSTPEATPETTATPEETTTPEATPEATTPPESTPEATETPEATATARATATPAPTLQPTPEPTVTETPEATPVPTATETTQPIPTPTPTPEATPTVEVEILVPEPPSPDDPDATDDPEPTATPEVLGSQLANTGVSTATANASKIGVVLMLGGGALVAAGARRRTAALD